MYKDNKQADDVIISASPGFLLEVICNRLRIDNLLASRVDKNIGRYDGTNCSGMEKVRRFKEIYGEAQIDAFYSDSQSDEPLAKLAKKAFIVVWNDTREWEIK